MSKERRYGNPSAWNPKGCAENLKRCIEEVHDTGRLAVGFHQCCRKRGHGKDGLYCKQHAKMQEGE